MIFPKRTSPKSPRGSATIGNGADGLNIALPTGVLTVAAPLNTDVINVAGFQFLKMFVADNSAVSRMNVLILEIDPTDGTTEIGTHATFTTAAQNTKLWVDTSGTALFDLPILIKLRFNSVGASTVLSFLGPMTLLA